MSRLYGTMKGIKLGLDLYINLQNRSRVHLKLWAEKNGISTRTARRLVDTIGEIVPITDIYEGKERFVALVKR